MFKYYENVFDRPTYDQINSESEAGFKSTGLFNSYAHWPEYIVKDSAPVLAINVLNDTTTFRMFNIITNDLFNRSAKSIMFYYWMSGSHIPWHTDGHKDAALTYYINEVWDRDWGGLYLYKPDPTSDDIHAKVPRYNTLGVQTNKMPHAISSTTKSAPIRRTVQVFI